MAASKIISGGQSGVDRAALDEAIALGLAHGGWCPKGRWAEDGPIDARYGLTETPSADPAERTYWNVRDAAATLILNAGRLAGGTRLTAELAEASGRPCLMIDLGEPDAASRIARWLGEADPAVLNVAGPRASEAPGVYQRARAVLGEALASLPRAGPGP